MRLGSMFVRPLTLLVWAGYWCLSACALEAVYFFYFLHSLCPLSATLRWSHTVQLIWPQRLQGVSVYWTPMWTWLWSRVHEPCLIEEHVCTQGVNVLLCYSSVNNEKLFFRVLAALNHGVKTRLNSLCKLPGAARGSRIWRT